MPYDTLINALLEEGRTKREAILRTAQIAAEELLNDARRQCETLEREADDAIHRHVSAQRTAILSKAALSARHVLLQAKRDLLDMVWQQAGRKAMALTGHARKKVLRSLVEEVLAATSSRSPRLIIDTRERRDVEDILKERGIAFEEQCDDGLLLGVRLEADGEVLTNGFAARLKKAKPELTMELNRLLFADGGERSAGHDGVLGKTGT